MKIAFENNNGSFIKKLASRSLKADKRRNVFLIFTISLAVCLMSLVAFQYAASRERTLNQIRGNYQAGVNGITREEAQRLAAAGEFKEYGLEAEAGTVKYQDTNLLLYYKDKGMLALDQSEVITGTYPEKSDELALERAFLNYFNMDQDIGGFISLDLGQGLKEYKITGIIEKENISRMYQCLVPDTFLNQKGNEERLYTLRFIINDGDELDPDALKAKINDFFNRMQLIDEKLFFSSNYFDLVDLYIGSDSMVYVAALFIAIACSVVIYNIFYISVTGKMHEYGRLKIIGATKGQLKGIVKRERRILSWISIPLGILAGAVISALLVPGYFPFSADLKYAVMIMLITEFVILISTHKPLQLVGKVSAVESVRQTAYSGIPDKKESKKLYRRLSPFSLAAMYFKRNPKKAWLTFVSLGLTGILLMCIASYAESMDLNEMAKRNLGDGGNYLITWSGFGDETFTDLIKDNPLSEELRKQLLNLEGMDKITSYSLCSVLIPELHETDYFDITGLNREQFKQRLTPDLFLEGNADYDALLSGKGILAVQTDDNLLKMLYGRQYHAGDKISLMNSEKEVIEYEVMGVIRSVNTGIGGSLFVMPEEAFYGLYPDGNNFTGCFNLYTADEDAARESKELREHIFQAGSEERLLIVSRQDLVDQLTPSFNYMIKSIYGLFIFIFLFSAMNLINTLITNLITRQQEIGILQSVGLSGSQLSKMLSIECLYFCMGTLGITLTAGTLCSIICCRLFDQIGIFGNITYQFPTMEVLTFSGVLLVIQCTFSAAAVWYSKRQSLVERIKVMD